MIIRFTPYTAMTPRPRRVIRSGMPMRKTTPTPTPMATTTPMPIIFIPT